LTLKAIRAKIRLESPRERLPPPKHFRARARGKAVAIGRDFLNSRDFQAGFAVPKLAPDGPVYTSNTPKLASALVTLLYPSQRHKPQKCWPPSDFSSATAAPL
jgi:hypothetical protein